MAQQGTLLRHFCINSQQRDQVDNKSRFSSKGVFMGKMPKIVGYSVSGLFNGEKGWLLWEEDDIRSESELLARKESGLPIPKKHFKTRMPFILKKGLLEGIARYGKNEA